MKIMEKNKDKIIFTCELSEELANAVRRYINQIPVLAIDEVEISMNDSPLYDETLAHRLALVPLKAKGAINEKTNVELKLSSKKEGYVYSGELKGDAEVVYKNMPLTILKEGQEIKLKGIARAGKGSEHAKFSPGLMFYRNVFDIKIEKDCPLEVSEICPKKALGIKDNKVIVNDGLKCDGCELCSETINKNGKELIKIIPSKEMLITIESFGQIDSPEIFKKALDLLKKDLSNLVKEIA